MFGSLRGLRCGGLRLSRQLCLVCLSFLAASTLNAQSWPSKPIHVVVPFAPGGPADLLPRLIGPKLTEAWGQPVIVDNKPGAGGNIGMDAVAKAAPDGYTLVIGPTGNLVVNPHLYPNLPYDVVRDFAPVTLIATFSNVLVVNPDVPVKSVNDLIALAKAKPGTLSFGSPGTGSQPHLGGEYLRQLTGIDILHVPYNGTAPALRDLLGGQISFMFAQTSAALPQIQSGKLRALGVASPKRAIQIPDVPTIAESGLPGFEAVSWYALLAPAATPKDIVAKLQVEIARILQLPEIREKLTAQGGEAAGTTPEQLRAQIARESARYADIVKRGNIKAE
ncbi:MAG: tripartite tricarboxylate transporter substrate binding protein [Betaproteobacteria bacterium]